MAHLKKDIRNKKDIQQFLELFYHKVKEDRLLKVYFKSFDDQWWDVHIPIMTAFWNNVVFYSDDYEGNPMDTHYKIHQINKLTDNAFNRWLALFEEVVTSLFEGENVKTILSKSQSIASILEERMHYQKGNNIE